MRFADHRWCVSLRNGNDRRAAEEPIKHTRTIIGLADVPRRFPFWPLRRLSPASVPQGCRRPVISVKRAS
jgi:hypothetical protein